MSPNWMPDGPQTMAERLRWCRENFQGGRLTQEEAAKRMGISRPATISDWERGESEPEDDNLKAAASIYGVTVDWLRFGDRGAKAYLQLAERWEELSREGRRYGLSETAADILLECASALRKVVRQESGDDVTPAGTTAPPGDSPNVEGTRGNDDPDRKDEEGAA